MTQLDLTLARRTDPVSSHEAARRSRYRSRSVKARILHVLEMMISPISAETIAVMLRLAPYEVRKRLPEMEREGLVRAVNRETMRPGDVLLWVRA